VEEHLSKSVIRPLTPVPRSSCSIAASVLAICALVAIPNVTPAEAGMHHNRHIKKHGVRPLAAFPSADQARHAQPLYQPSEVCPGNARAFECKIWPPPMYDDPDRRNPSSDGGGGG
jgi:hypothetical protein